MSLPVQLISTDFDGTLFAEFEDPPVPPRLQHLLTEFQQSGGCWVINTGRELTNLLETMARARLTVHPDYLVVVEREIFIREGQRYTGLKEWNDRCTHAHEELFSSIRDEVPALMSWVTERFQSATVYEDPWSPLCLIAENNEDADAIQEYLEAFCARVPDLVWTRNDVYARFSHAAYDKGSALAEIARILKVSPRQIIAAGDHLNDLSMLQRSRAVNLVAPANAVPLVKKTVLRQGGFVSQNPCGWGIAEGLERVITGTNSDK